MIDFSSIDVEDLLARLGLDDGARLTSGGNEIHFPCFGPEHSDGGAAYINTNTGLWVCHGCHARGNAVTLVAEVRGVSRPTAERELREWYGIEFNEPIGGSMVAEVEARLRPVAVASDPIRPPRSWLISARFDWVGGERREPQHQYMLDRGFSPATLADFDVGYDYLSDRLTIPVFDVDGELFGIKGRAWCPEQQPKYWIIGDTNGNTHHGFSTYEAAQVVFGLHRERHVRRGVICEGELNAMALSQLGVPRPVAAGMSYFSQRHAELLIREFDEVVVFFDKGQAGHDGTWGRINARGEHSPGVVQMLEPFMRVRIAEPIDEDPADLLQAGRGHEALQIIADAKSSLADALSFR